MGKIKPNLIETVARALCKEDIREGIKNLTNEQYEALTYFINRSNEMRSVWNTVEGRKHWNELLLLWGYENRETPKQPKFICKIDGDNTDGYWEDYKRFAAIAIESYDGWLNFRKNLEV
jgi:hypothetical protein